MQDRSPPARRNPLATHGRTIHWVIRYRSIGANAERCPLRPESDRSGARNIRQTFVAWISDDIEQLLDTHTADRRDDPELGKMGTDRIDHSGLLANEQMARAMEHQAALLLGRLGLDKAHVGPGDRLANGLRVSGIVLLPFDVGFHIGRWHQAHGVAERLELTRPMV